MEVEEVEAKVKELMEIEEESMESRYEENFDLALSNQEKDLDEMTCLMDEDSPYSRLECEDLEMDTEGRMEYSAPINHHEEDDRLYDDPSSQQGDHLDMESEEMSDAFSNQHGDQDIRDNEMFANHAPSYHQGDCDNKKEEFNDITIMISLWEAQEAEEDTPIVEMVRRKRRSAKLDRIVQKPHND